MSHENVVVGGGLMGTMIALDLAKLSRPPIVYDDPDNLHKAADHALGIIEDNEVPGDGFYTDKDSHDDYLSTDAWYRQLSKSSEKWAKLIHLGEVLYGYKDVDKDFSFLKTYAAPCQAGATYDKEIPPHLLRIGIRSCARFFAPILDVPNILRELRNEAESHGVKFVPEKIVDFDRFKDSRLLIKATGIRRLMDENDTTIRARRGQTLILESDEPHGIISAVGMPGDPISFNVVPRNPTTVVLGATKEWDNLIATPFDEISEELFRVGCLLCPEISKMKIVRAVVGFRPVRSKILLQRNVFPDGRIRWDVNGTGGGGWSICKGLAERVAAGSIP